MTVHPDGSGVIMLAKAHGAAFVQIWQLFRDGSQRTLTNDLSDYRELSLRADGSAFVTVQTQTLSRLWLLRKMKRNRLRSVPARAVTTICASRRTTRFSMRRMPAASLTF